ncbi:MAG: DUF6952 family protein [Bacteroidia bacterium]
MKLPEIKRLATQHNLNELKLAEENITNGIEPNITVNGEDEGEKLTHVLGAIDVITIMQQNNVELPVALRKFSERVRNSIS